MVNPSACELQFCSRRIAFSLISHNLCPNERSDSYMTVHSWGHSLQGECGFLHGNERGIHIAGSFTSLISWLQMLGQFLPYIQHLITDSPAAIKPYAGESIPYGQVPYLFVLAFSHRNCKARCTKRNPSHDWTLIRGRSIIWPCLFYLTFIWLMKVKRQGSIPSAVIFG